MIAGAGNPAMTARRDGGLVAPDGVASGAMWFCWPGPGMKWTARPGQPKQRIEKTPSIAARTTLPLAKPPGALPLIVVKYLACHTSPQKPVLNQIPKRGGSMTGG